jgi:hypothetical protein
VRRRRPARGYSRRLSTTTKGDRPVATKRTPDPQRDANPGQRPEAPLAETPAATASDLTPPTDPESALQWMNERHVVARDGGGRTNVLTEAPADGSECRRIVCVWSSITSFNDFYANRHVVIPGAHGRERRVGLAPWWPTHPLRRTEGRTVVLSGAWPEEEEPR